MADSVQHLPGYRLELKMPRDLQSDAVLEPDVLVPRDGAEHAEPFRLTTVPGDTWGRGYLGIPSGRRGTLDLRSRKVTVGGVSVNLLDPRLADDDAVRWLTQFLGDANGNPQLAARLRGEMWQTLDGGCSWDPYFVGRSVRATKPSPAEYALELQDMAGELQRDCFVGPPHASVDYAQLAPLLPYGLVEAWNGFDAIPGMAPGLKATAADGRPQIRVSGSSKWDRYTLICADLRARAELEAQSKRIVSLQAIVLDYAGERVKVRVRNPATDAEGWFWLRRIIAQRNVEGHFVARQLYLAELAFPLTTWATLGATDAALEYACYANDALGDTGALLIGPVHPVKYLRDLVDGKFGYLDDAGAVRRQVPRDDTARSGTSSSPTSRSGASRSSGGRRRASTRRSRGSSQDERAGVRVRRRGVLHADRRAAAERVPLAAGAHRTTMSSRRRARKTGSRTPPARSRASASAGPTTARSTW
jgi:hypothetical protein